MSDNGAVLQGYTKEIIASAYATELHLLVKPETDLDSFFKAWDCDEQEFITVTGWLYTIEDIEQ